MKNRNEKSDQTDVREKPVRHRSGKEKRLIDILNYWGFYHAAANIEVHRERVDLDVAIASS